MDHEGNQRQDGTDDTGALPQVHAHADAVDTFLLRIDGWKRKQ